MKMWKETCEFWQISVNCREDCFIRNSPAWRLPSIVFAAVPFAGNINGVFVSVLLLAYGIKGAVINARCTIMFRSSFANTLCAKNSIKYAHFHMYRTERGRQLCNAVRSNKNVAVP
jgi:hypothetical protein